MLLDETTLQFVERKNQQVHNIFIPNTKGLMQSQICSLAEKYREKKTVHKLFQNSSQMTNHSKESRDINISISLRSVARKKTRKIRKKRKGRAIYFPLLPLSFTFLIFRVFFLAFLCKPS